jgi:hypothetical protein
MKKKSTKHPDLPPRSHPDYMKLYRAKHGEKAKAYMKEYYRKKVEENPNYNTDNYDAEYNREYREKNRPMLMEKHWKKMGIVDLTYEQYEKDLKAQDNKCQICDNEMSTPHADHCHTTGKYRGILCAACNTGLGIYEKNRERFEEYLGKFVS